MLDIHRHNERPQRRNLRPRRADLELVRLAQRQHRLSPADTGALAQHMHDQQIHRDRQGKQVHRASVP